MKSKKCEKCWKRNATVLLTVIKDMMHGELPEGFQTAGFLLDHGLVDAIIPRKELRKRLIDYLDFMNARHTKAVVAG